MRITLEKALVGLIVLTLLALLAERSILGTSLTLDADSGYVDVYNDSDEGGASQSRIINSADMEWSCVLRPGHNFPYCGFELILDLERQMGLDLSAYDRVRLWLDYEGPTETIRFYLRNFDPRYSVPGENDTTKYNQVEFSADLARGDDPLEFSMGDFFVANWWFQRYRISPELAHPQFDNIVVIEVQTGVDITPGEHRFRLERIEFSGQLVSSEQWYQLILAVWVLAGMLLLVVRAARLKRELRRKGQREKELTEVNALLDARGRVLEERARRDPLTGAFNRAGLEQTMREGLVDWRQHARPLSIVMMDLDHFKQVNDRHGHSEGDRVLSRVAEVVRDNIRSSDAFARWGGEEFVLLCRDTQLGEATQLADKLRERIAQAHIGPDAGISASFGVATLRRGEDLETLFDRADRALYVAKDKGRNRVQPAR